MKIDKKNKLNKIFLNIKKMYVKLYIAFMFAVTLGLQKPAYADIPTFTFPGASGMVSSLRNVIIVIGLFFIGAGLYGAMSGGHRIFQSLKEQNGDAKSTSIIEFIAGLGSLAIGSSAAYYATMYIVMPS